MPATAAAASGESVAVAGVVVAGGGGVAGVGGSRNDAGSMPTLLETIAGAPAVVAGVPSLNDGSTPTEFEITGGSGAVGDAAAEDADAAGSGGVTSRLSFTTGTRTVRVPCCFSGCAGAIACVACRCAAAGALKTSGGAAAFVRGAFAGTAAGTRRAGNRKEAMLSSCKEWVRGGADKKAARTSGAA